MSSVTTFFRYSGSKVRFIDLINRHLVTSKDVYCEPFVGSGAVVFNLEKEFSSYILGDIDRNIISIYSSFSKISYSDYVEILESVKTKFGEFKSVGDQSTEKAKENYYAFRDWFNAESWMSGSIEEGVYLHILSNSCINSFLRFGPNGMNQSFGDRSYILPEKDFNKVHSVLKKTHLHCGSYKDLIDNQAFFFFDPPYASQNSSYLGFSKSDLREFIASIQGKEFLYTDILNEENSILENRVKIREMVSTAPSTTKAKNGNEEFLFGSKPFILL